MNLTKDFEIEIDYLETLLAANNFLEVEKELSVLDKNKLNKKQLIAYLLIEVKLLNKKNDFLKQLEISKKLRRLCNSKEFLEIYIESTVYLSIALWRLGRIEDSINELLDIEDHLRDANSQKLAGLYYHILGTIYWSYGKLDLALQKLNRSLENRQKTNDKVAISKTINNIGLVYLTKGKIDKTIEFYKKSLELKKELGELSSIASTLNNIGGAYLRIGKYRQALDYCLKSLKIREEIGNEFDIARSKNALGNLYYEMGNLDIALQYYKQSYAIFKEYNTRQDIAYSLNNIGFIYFEQGNLKLAKNYLKKSTIIFKEVGNKQDLAGNLENLGQISRLSGYLHEALRYFNESLEYRKKIGNKSEIADSLENRGYTLFLMGKQSDALNDYEKCLKLRKIVNNQTYTSLTLLKLIQLYYYLIENEKRIIESGTKIENKVDSYFQLLKKINSKFDNYIVETNYQLAYCLKIIHKGNSESYQEIIEILLSILNNDEAFYKDRVSALLSLSNVYYQLFIEQGDINYISKINDLIKHSLAFASKQKITSTKLNLQILQSKLAIFENKFNQAFTILKSVWEIAKNLGYYTIKSKCEEELKKIKELDILDVVLTNFQNSSENITNSYEIVEFLKEIALNIQYIEKIKE